MAGPTIGNWDTGRLTKYVQDSLGRAPAQNFQGVIADDIEVVNRLVVSGELITPGGWRVIGTTGSPAFSGTWVNTGGAAVPVAQFFKDVLGIVHLRGRISAGTLGTAAFTLPPGFRPPYDLRFAVDSNGAYGRVTVLASGAVQPDVGSTAAVSLDGIQFKI